MGLSIATARSLTGVIPNDKDSRLLLSVPQNWGTESAGGTVAQTSRLCSFYPSPEASGEGFTVGEEGI